jgi:hypothetical protein
MKGTQRTTFTRTRFNVGLTRISTNSYREDILLIRAAVKMFADEVKTEAVKFLYSSDILYNRTPAMITEVSSLNVCDTWRMSRAPAFFENFICIKQLMRSDRLILYKSIFGRSLFTNTNPFIAESVKSF